MYLTIVTITSYSRQHVLHNVWYDSRLCDDGERGVGVRMSCMAAVVWP